MHNSSYWLKWQTWLYGAGSFIKKPLKLLEKLEARNYTSYICGLQINHILTNKYCPFYIKSVTCSRY